MDSVGGPATIGRRRPTRTPRASSVCAAVEAPWAHVPPLTGCGAYSSSTRPLPWRQNEAMVQLWWPLAEGTRMKSDVEVALATHAISLRIRDSDVLDQFSLPHKIDTEASTWYSDEGIDGRRWL
eukprot:597582-Prymnesium_polylepis.1